MFKDLSTGEIVTYASVVALLGILLFVWWDDQMFAEQQYEEALVRCDSHEDPGACVAGVEARHEECFRAYFQSGGRFSDDSLDVTSYDYCVIHGVEASRAAKAKARRERSSRYPTGAPGSDDQ